MSATSAPPPTDRDRTLERLIGVRSSKPSFYAAWRENAERLDRSIETLERISSALCAAPDGPGALCDAVVEAAAHHFDAPWAAMIFTGESEEPGARPCHPSAARAPWSHAPDSLSRCSSSWRAGHSRPRRPVMIDAGDLGDGAYELTDATGGVVAAPMPVQGELVGVLAVGLRRDAVVQSTDLSILVTLANHAGVALHHAQLFAQSERVRRRLEEAGRRELLSRERNRIARELHDSVAQHLLTIGMDLEWCRRHDSTSPPVLERVTAAKSLARSAVDEIRAVIFELASDGDIDLRRALHEVIEDVVAGTRLQVRPAHVRQPAAGRRAPLGTRSCRSRARPCSTSSVTPTPVTRG